MTRNSKLFLLASVLWAGLSYGQALAPGGISPNGGRLNNNARLYFGASWCEEDTSPGLTCQSSGDFFFTVEGLDAETQTGFDFYATGFAFPSGSFIEAPAASTVKLNSYSANTGSLPAYLLTTNNTLSGSTLLLDIQNNGTSKWKVNNAGATTQLGGVTATTGTFSGALSATALTLSTTPLPIASGGTGQATATLAFDALAPSQASANLKFLTSNGTDTSWALVPLTTGVTGTLPLGNGGTGQVTANAAFNALAPSQASASGKYLTSNGTDTSWATITTGVTTLGAVGGTTNANGGTISGSTLTLAPADGSFPGLLSTSTQTIAGAKTLSSALTISATSIPLTFSGTGNNQINSATANGGSAVGFLFNTTQTFTGGTARLFQFTNNTTSWMEMDPNGALYLNAVAGNTALTVKEGTYIGLNQGTGNSYILTNTSTHGVEFSANTTNSGSNSAFLFTAHNSMSGSTLLANFENVSGTSKVAFTNAGDIKAVGTNPVPSLHASQSTAAQALEYGSQTLTTGSATVTFATAFASAPKCVCDDASALLNAQCTTSASQLTITGTGSDSVTYICIGAR